MQKLSIKGLAIGLGTSWAICMLFLGWVSILGWGAGFVDMMSSAYIGFSSTFLGGIIGAVWAFIDGAFGGAIIALVYNAVIRKRE